MTQATDLKPLAPIVDAASAPYWKAAQEGRLLFKRCSACGKPHWYPRALCPYCMSDATEWETASGQGAVYSVSVNRTAAAQPYALAYVQLDEGITLLTHIVGTDLNTVRIGDRVRVRFIPAEDGQGVPVFAPV